MSEPAIVNQPTIGDPAVPGPRHVAIIMDGNGRWAQARGLPRSEGHRRGVEAVRRTVTAAQNAGVEYLTIFSFSSENWSRPASEVEFLLGLLRIFIRRDLARLHRQGVRVRVIGQRESLPGDIEKLIAEAEEKTRFNNGLNFVVAFNYGARDELVRAMKEMAYKVARGEIEPDDIDQDRVSEHLDTRGMPDPDLVIRTSGEIRISNFLLWQSAYAEFVFLPICWPEFDADAFDNAISEFSGRKRRYGGLTK